MSQLVTNKKKYITIITLSSMFFIGAILCSLLFIHLKANEVKNTLQELEIYYTENKQYSDLKLEEEFFQKEITYSNYKEHGEEISNTFMQIKTEVENNIFQQFLLYDEMLKLYENRNYNMEELRLMIPNESTGLTTSNIDDFSTLYSETILQFEDLAGTIVLNESFIKTSDFDETTLSIVELSSTGNQELVVKEVFHTQEFTYVTIIDGQNEIISNIWVDNRTGVLGIYENPEDYVFNKSNNITYMISETQVCEVTGAIIKNCKYSADELSEKNIIVNDFYDSGKNKFVSFYTDLTSGVIELDENGNNIGTLFEYDIVCDFRFFASDDITNPQLVAPTCGNYEFLKTDEHTKSDSFDKYIFSTTRLEDFRNGDNPRNQATIFKYANKDAVIYNEEDFSDTIPTKISHDEVYFSAKNYKQLTCTPDDYAACAVNNLKVVYKYDRFNDLENTSNYEIQQDFRNVTKGTFYCDKELYVFGTDTYELCKGSNPGTTSVVSSLYLNDELLYEYEPGFDEEDFIAKIVAIF